MRIGVVGICILLALGAWATPAVADGDIVVTGMVVDEGRRPQQGAHVEIRHGDVLRRGETDAAGRYRVSLPWPDGTPTGPIAVLARSADEDAALGGWKKVDVDTRRPGPQRAPIVALTHLHLDTLTLRGPDGPMEGVELMLSTGGSYGRRALMPLRSGPGGQVSLRMPKGAYTLVVTDPRWASAERDVNLPRPRERTPTSGVDPQVLQLVPTRSVRVRVLDEESGAPLEGASVRRVTRGRGFEGLPLSAPVVQTDAGGEAVLLRLPVGASVSIGAWTSKPRSSAKLEVAPDQGEVELRLPRAPTYTARWPLADNAHRPPEGAELIFRPNRYEAEDDRSARVEQGHVVLEEYKDTSDYAFAVYEERTAARLRYELVNNEIGEATVMHSLPASFIPAATVRVRLVDEHGAPVAGLRVEVDGWVMIRDAQGRLTRTSMPRGDATDDAGEVAWEGVFFGPCRLKLLRGAGQTLDRVLGEINPRPGSARTYEYVIPTPRTVALHVRLDGTPGLRADLDVYCGGHLDSYEADPAMGIIRFAYRPKQDGTSPSLTVNAGGYVSWSGSIDPAQKGPLRFDVDLRTSLTLSVALVPEPSEWVDGDVIQVQRLDRAKDRWVRQGDCGYARWSCFAIAEVKAKGLACWRLLTGLKAGTYRLVHVPTGVAASSFTIDNSKPIWVTRYVLPTARTVRGRFVTKARIPWSEAWIDDIDAAPGLRWDSEDDERREFRGRGGVKDDGSFEISIAAGADVRLRLSHPLLQPCVFAAPADLDKPLEVLVTPKVILEIPCACRRDKLPEGVTAGAGPFRFSDFLYSDGVLPPSWDRLGLSLEQSAEDAPRVWQAGEDESGRTTWTLLLRTYDAKTQTIRVGLAQGGRHTFFVDFDDRAPFVIRDLRVPAEGLAMGPVPPPRGSRVQVAVRPSARNDVRSVTVYAWPVDDDGPAWHRHTTRIGKRIARGPSHEGRLKPGPVTTLYGLRRGTYRVRVTVQRAHGALDGAPDHVERTLRVDGNKDVPFTADFRTPAEIARAKKRKAGARR